MFSTKSKPKSPNEILDEFNLWHNSCDYDQLSSRLWEYIYTEGDDDNADAHPELYRMIMHTHNLLGFMLFMAAKNTGWDITMLKDFKSRKEKERKCNK